MVLKIGVGTEIDKLSIESESADSTKIGRIESETRSFQKITNCMLKN
jgi:hypothetical protein